MNNTKTLENFKKEFSNGTENAIGQPVFSPEYDCQDAEFFLKVQRFIIKELEFQKQQLQKNNKCY